MPIKALLFTPTFFPSLTGNAVTVARISAGLAREGVESRIVDISRSDLKEVEKITDRFQPHLLHAFHALKTGPLALKLAQERSLPLITSMTGTDIHVDLACPERLADIRAVISGSGAVTVFNEAAREMIGLAGLFPREVGIIHQSVRMPPQVRSDIRRDLDLQACAKVFLFLGALRKIKGLSLALEVMDKLARRESVFLIVAGEIHEEGEFLNLKQHQETKKWLRYAGAVPREKIASLFQAADVFLSTSLAESESNALLEAMYYSKCIIARDIPGNSSQITRREGFLFQSAEDLYEAALLVVREPALIAAKGALARKKYDRDFSFTKERRSYRDLYRRILERQGENRPVGPGPGKGSETALISGRWGD
jgi:glycosyltransferase involved in cell wall biosynthesis